MYSVFEVKSVPLCKAHRLFEIIISKILKDNPRRELKLKTSKDLKKYDFYGYFYSNILL